MGTTFKKYVKGNCDYCGEHKRVGIHQVKVCDKCFIIGMEAHLK